MNKNRQTSELVKEFFENSPLIASLCKKGIINYSALSKEYFEYFKKQNEKITYESVMISMKRYILKLHNQDNSQNSYLKQLKEIMKSIQIALTNNFSIYLLNNTHNLDLASFNSYFVLKNQENNILICDDNTLDFKVLNQNIVKISLIEKRLKMNSQYFSGLYSHILTLLSNQNITILECISSYDSLHLFFEEKDSIKAYEILSKNIQFSNLKEA